MRKSKRRLKEDDRVEFISHDEQCKPFKQIGIVRLYVYPHSFNPNSYIEIVDENKDLIFYGNAGDDIQKSK
ncbi:MAG: hypothetical protein V7L21_25735 [Nostoc sp.]|uniref:hypothetical protein n=1 Tax=unclassified Nostoc TaxID=2593658 RepID=UPI0025F04D18|nr:hypothetical protein [Nostoc sp. NMS9]MBN3938474.1 hypothetical protein [Nostoc sp. NMS9]